MSNFDQAVAVVFVHEGGYTNNPNDAGGPTNLGLTFADMREVGLPATIEQIKSLTPATAKPIYQKLYWDVMNLDLITDYHVALCLFDQGVLQGPATAIEKMQSLLGVNPDGKIGTLTAAAINKEDGLKLSFKFIRSDLHRYNAIVKGKLSQVEFLDGWDDRLFSLLDVIFFGDIT